MEKIKSKHFNLKTTYSSSSTTITTKQTTTTKSSSSSSFKFEHQSSLKINSNHQSRIPCHHPLKLFIDFHSTTSSSQAQKSLKNYPKSYYPFFPILNKRKFNSNLISFFHHPSLLQFNINHHNLHSFHRPHSTSTLPHQLIPQSIASSSSSQDISPNHSQNQLDSSHQIQTSWWQCSSKPIESDKMSSNFKKISTNYKSSTHHKSKLNNDRSQSFQNYISQVSQLQSLHSPSTTNYSSQLNILNQNLQKLLNENNFQKDFKIIWSDFNSIEETSKDPHVKFKIIEFQRKSIDFLLNTLINSLGNHSHSEEYTSSSQEDFKNKINIFNQVVEFLIFTNQEKFSNKTISILGLDPIEGWRNLVKQHRRIRTLSSLISFINIFNPKIPYWWTTELNKAKDNSNRLNQLAQIGIFLISALSKQGSVWQAFQLFLMMDKLPINDSLSDDLKESVQPISHQRRAATALGLVDALISRKRIDYANQLLETVSIGEWIEGTIYRRYLLSMLTVKGAQGDISSVEKIGLAYQRAWVNSKVMIESLAGRNKRARGFQVQDPRIPVARAKIEALGVLGETRSAIETFQETLATVPPKFGVSSQLPDLYAEIMRVHLKADDPRGIERLITKMKITPDSYGFHQPDQRHYNILLQAFANRSDVEGCSSVLDQFFTAGIPPDIYTYGNICLLFANLGEPDFIRQVIEALAKRSETHNQSLKPNRELWNILLDAYIESGDWSRAAKLLEYLELEDNRTKQSDVVTNGSVLKALVVSGSPTEKVLETFMSMYNPHTGLAADARSYASLLLSLCDSGMMDLAERMFYSLKDSATDSKKQTSSIWDSIKPNVYLYGIMISAFLRIGMLDLAQGYLREMQSSGIRPSLVIYSMLTSAYAASKTSGMKHYSWNEAENQMEEEEIQQDGVWVAQQMASQFQRELLDNEAHLKGRLNDQVEDKKAQETSHWGELPIIRKRLSHRLLGPIIQSYAKSARPAKALEMLRELVASLGSDYNSAYSDGKPVDLDIFTMLLDAYRRAQDPVGVIEVWNEIFRIATQNKSDQASQKLLMKVLSLIETGENKTDDQIVSKNCGLDDPKQRKTNKLCLPLSIYTDCLSRHGYHEEVALTWNQVQQAGFGFDAGNWNELCAALFRSGNHRMGWLITERIFFNNNNNNEKGEEEIEKIQVNNSQEIQSFSEDLKWSKILDQTIGFRSVRPAHGLQGTTLDGAQKVETPLRPPNRTFVRKTRRFDDPFSVQKCFQSLLNRSKDPLDSSFNLNDQHQKIIWSEELNYITQLKRDSDWKPYDHVSRMLHGSLWRECADLILKKYHDQALKTNQDKLDRFHHSEKEKEGQEEQDEEEKNKILKYLEEKGNIHQLIHEILDLYQLNYPLTFAHVLDMNDNSDIPKHLNLKNLFHWNKFDFISRVIKRTFQRILIN